MYINLESDYAVRIVSYLAKNKEKSDAKTIAEHTGVTLRFALKILRKLVAAQVIQSFKGTQGGYVIAREPSEISLLEIIETVEGKYCFSRCLGDDHECADWCSGSGCKVQHIYSTISATVREQLERVTFDQLI